MRDSRWRNATVLAVLVLVTEILPWLVQRAGTPGWGGWYILLAKPDWNPPSWLFAVVWPMLYLTMAVAAWLVWRRGGRAATAALGLYAAQLLVNASWTWVFIGLQSIPGAFAVIVLLWLLVAATAVAFRRHSRTAALLMLPYLAWVTFAGILTAAIWRLNG